MEHKSFKLIKSRGVGGVPKDVILLWAGETIPNGFDEVSGIPTTKIKVTWWQRLREKIFGRRKFYPYKGY